MHTLYVNRTDKPLIHPRTGQVLMPGQSYLEPPGLDHIEPKQVAPPLVRVQKVADPGTTLRAMLNLRKRKEGQ